MASADDGFSTIALGGNAAVTTTTTSASNYDHYHADGGLGSDSEDDDVLDLDLRQSTPLGEVPTSHADTEVLLNNMQLQFQHKSKTAVFKDRGCCIYFRSPAFLIYCCQALSTWGYRMWTFAISMYLVAIDMESLRVIAIYGLTICASSLLFGPAIGEWVDRNQRLKVIRISLLLQNSSLVICASLLSMLLFWEGNVKLVWDGVIFFIVILTIIILGDCTHLAGQAERIAIQKDWVVVLAGTDKARLASLNAMLVRIDLVSEIVAPIFIGWVMTFGSLLAGTLVIAGWALLAGLLEYYLMWKIFTAVPALSVKKRKTFSESSEGGAEEHLTTVSVIEEEQPDESETPGDKMFSLGSDSENSDTEINVSREDLSRGQQQQRRHDSEGNLSAQEVRFRDIKDEKELREERLRTLKSLCGCCINFGKGWKVYMSYKVCLAGIGLALLYMNLLSFDYVAIGYAYSQGVKVWVIGVLRAVASLLGIVGTLVFPVVRRKIGLERTGLWALLADIACLSLCVFSIWAPGSPLDLSSGDNPPPSLNSTLMQTTTPGFNFTTTSGGGNFTMTTYAPYDPLPHPPDSYTSITLFFVGMITAKLGMWMFDLTVTQLIQEHVLETQRGVVNGVQNALNGMMDMLQFMFVIIAPQARTFGVLILLSFVFVCFGGSMYSMYSYKARGHLCHFEKLTGKGGRGTGYTRSDNTETEITNV